MNIMRKYIKKNGKFYKVEPAEKTELQEIKDYLKNVSNSKQNKKSDKDTIEPNKVD